AEALEKALPGRVHRGSPLAPLTTYRLGGPAAVLVEPAAPDDLTVVAEALRDAPNVAVLVLGRGSNTVVSDEGWPGLVVHASSGLAWIEEGAGEGDVVAGAGTSMPQLANWAARRGLAGLEFLVSIPGSVGGGVRMNAGAHGTEIADHLVAATVLDLQARTVETLAVADLGMSYRRSSLGAEHFVIDARFSLEVAPRAAIRERMESFRRHRAATQPGAALNAGSVFKNPPGDYAGRLVEATGLKGFSVGGARVSEKHANFFVAGEGATAQDVFDLVHAVRARVAAATGIELEPEVRFAGSFRSPAAAEAGS
ncbi:MAG: UDP-N-acetylmuramate dehydrogenase, partial [Actinomycetota bacterium]|nr:UDP-N-acetylmuramate dehydrogenase [Actinomycetota bacterium]